MAKKRPTQKTGDRRQKREWSGRADRATDPHGAAFRRRHAWLVHALAIVIVATGIWAYATSFAGVFVLDDVRAIARNPTIRTLWPLSVPLAPPTASTVAGRPVANLSLAVNYALAPPDAREVFEVAGPGVPPGTAERLSRNAAGYHAVNLLFHLAAALALFGVVRRTLLSWRLKPVFDGAALWIALVVALLWVAHPLTTAAVTYIVQRVESLMGLFYLLTLYCAIRASGAGAHWRAWTAAAIATCALGMATKEAMVGAPLVAGAWLWIFAPDGRQGAASSGQDGVRRRETEDGRQETGDKRQKETENRHQRTTWTPGVTLWLAATWIILAVLVYGERRAPSLGLTLPTAWRYLLTQAEVVVHYLSLAFAPTSLVFLYDWPLVDSLTAVWPQALFLAALAGVTAVGVVRRWPLSFLGVWFFLILAPSSSVLPVITEVAAEHRMYQPLAAILALVVVVVFLAGRRLPVNRRAVSVTALAATVAAVALLSTETRARNRDYWSDEALWQDTVAKLPDAPRPRVFYGSVLLRAGKVAEAEVQLQAAVELAPEDPVARVRLGAVLARQQKFDEAIPHLERAATNLPDDPAAYRMLGEIYAARGRDVLAAQNLERALAGMGDDPNLLARLAAILADSQDVSVRNGTKALGLAQRAVELTSRRHLLALVSLALAQGETGRLAEAAATAREALQLARAQNAGPAAIRELERRIQFYTRR